MRPTGSKQELEARRRVAVRLRRSGMTIREVAKIVGCAPGSVARWEGLFETGGARALDPIPGVGKQSSLKAKDRAKLERMLIAGPRAYGFTDGVWTLRRVRELMAERLGLEFSISHVHRLMHALGFSAQKPQVRAIERDEGAIAHFRRHQWSQVKKRPRKPEKRSR